MTLTFLPDIDMGILQSNECNGGPRWTQKQQYFSALIVHMNYSKNRYQNMHSNSGSGTGTKSESTCTSSQLSLRLPSLIRTIRNMKEELVHSCLLIWLPHLSPLLVERGGNLETHELERMFPDDPTKMVGR
jgi:hypothetical protein